MGRDAFEASSAARAVYEAADEALGFSDFSCLLCGAGRRAATHRNPATGHCLTTSVALLRALEEQTGSASPTSWPGHSLGEYTALVAAGALGLEDAVRTVHRRGGYMQASGSPGHVGSMAAIIGSTPEAVADVCAEVSLETRERCGSSQFQLAWDRR